jgi:formylglycine-generating enzyme required for sulfatase activity
MVLVDLPQAWVGCLPADTTCLADEKPGGWVHLRPFWLDVQEVTVGQFRAFAEATGRSLPRQPAGSSESHPVVNVTQGEAAAFCAFYGKRLPTEAEWEAAARGPLAEALYPHGLTLTHENANYLGTGGKDRFAGLAPVRSFPANALGLFDMAGNVWEWVADDFLPKPPTRQEAAAGGTLKVVKGGAWNSPPASLRISNRGRLPASTASDSVGFRCARDGDATSANPVSAPSSLPATQPSPKPEPKAPSPSGQAGELVEKLVGPAQVPMVFLPGGAFARGCVKGDSLCTADEQPRRRILLSPFAIGKTEVTVGQFRHFAEATGTPLPSQPTWSGDHFPVVNVTWQEAQAFCAWLGGRLPTEAEWEFAARGGQEGYRYPSGNSISHEEANFDGVEGRDQFAKAAPVGQFPPNPFGLFDMLGNVWEWCLDWYGEAYYAKSPEQDPQGPETGERKVVRGGSFTSDPGRLRLSYRGHLKPEERWVFTGFRCALPQASP